MEDEDFSAKFQPPGGAFKSRFLKTDRSEALKQEQNGAPLAAASASSGPLNSGLRSIRSTFSPLAKLPENVEVKANDADRLSKNIKDFINRTDHVSNEWKNLGQQKRSGSVERGSFYTDNDYQGDTSWSMKPTLSLRASSVAPMSRVGNPFENQFPRPSGASGLPAPQAKLDSAYGSYYKDNDFTDYSLSVRGVTHSVTNRARNGTATQGGVGGGGGGPLGPQRFMSLEEECNWILSGREPIVADHNGFYDDDDDEDNTLDDISGDEVNSN